MGEIADDMIEAEARGQDYESYMMDLAAETDTKPTQKKKIIKRKPTNHRAGK
jgi:hypothetical protein